MPKYKCIKDVWALKITAIERNEDVAGFELKFEGEYSVIHVTRDWVNNHQVEEGGYYVVYKDGYASYSPAQAFEEGYVLIEEDTIESPKVAEYEKKPVIIKALKYIGTNGNDVLRFLFPDLEPDASSFSGTINTLEGEMNVSVGDYIIQGIKGEFYACKPDIFAESYELVS